MTNKATWAGWNQNSATWSCTSATTTWNDLLWRIWTDQGTCASGSTTVTTNLTLYTHNVVWSSWNTNAIRIVSDQAAAVRYAVQATHYYQESAEQKAHREQTRREYTARRAAEDAARREADDRAERLLQSALTAEQREELKVKGHFHCRSRQGSLYRINRGSHGNIMKIVGGKPVEKLCVQPGGVPIPDMMLAQKLHIEMNEEDFRRTANKTVLN